MIKNYLYNTQSMLKVLIGSAIFMFVMMMVSMFIESAKIMGIGLLVFIVSVFWNMRLSFRDRDLSIGDFIGHVDNQYEEARKNKKHFQKGLYLVVIPMMAVGLIFVVLILVAFFTIL
jgi:c-di-AMP phosphodiesterase-like protein